MTQRQDPHPIRDFFVADIIDYAPKDERTMMERPFFSLAKRKRNKPIEYESDNKKIWVKVRAHPEFGMATIWDADILIWCISRVVAERDRGQNLEAATIHTTPYELLKGIARGTSGTEYRRLFEAMRRLRSTSIETNIRADATSRADKAAFANFNWLAEFQGEGNIDTPEQMESVRSIALTLPNWIYRAIIKSENVLTLDREYFLLTGGLDRALYRLARKHAGNQGHGWKCTIAQLHKKTGSESTSKKFAEMLRRAVKADKLPRYRMTWTNTQDGSPAVHFVDRGIADFLAEEKRNEEDAARRARIAAEDARTAFVDAGGRSRKAAN
jgi:plasmid replication initiation protein